MGSYDAAKHVLALQKLIPNEKMLIATGGSLITDVSQPGMALHERGAVAATASEVHYCRKRLGGADHRRLRLDDVTEVSTPTLDFGNVSSPGVVLETATTTWAVITSEAERDLFVKGMAEHGLAGLQLGPADGAPAAAGPSGSSSSLSDDQLVVLAQAFGKQFDQADYDLVLRARNELGEIGPRNSMPPGWRFWVDAYAALSGIRLGRADEPDVQHLVREAIATAARSSESTEKRDEALREIEGAVVSPAD